MTDKHPNHLLDHSNPERFRASRRATLVSILANLGLSLAQIVIGVLGQSQALVADGIHTLSDLLTDFMVLFAIYHSRKAADAEHPYGHGRIETAVTLILGLMLFAVGLGIMIRAGLNLYLGEAFVIPSVLTLVVAILTLAVKEGLYQYTYRIAQRYHSELLRSNAWHHRSDALSSLIVAAGIAGTLIGFVYLDSVAAIIVALMVIKIGIGLAWSALRELVDTALRRDRIAAIQQTIIDIPEVKSLHVLRTRQTGGKALVDVHVQVDSHISVSEGHHISEWVRQQVMKHNDDVSDVMVHVDPEDDEMTIPNRHLPLRESILPRLKSAWAELPIARHIQDDHIQLHYLDGKLEVVLALPLEVLENEPRAAQQRLAQQFDNIAKQFKEIERIALCFR